MGSNIMSLTGNEAAAWAVRRARARVGLSFPMGPNAEVTETLQGFIDKGEVKDLRILYGDNEKSAASMQIGIARLGVRSMLCINSEGILWATAEIHYAANSRLPLVLICPSRALEPPTTVFCDHDDFMTQRDMGWLMLYCSSPQDVFDTIIQAYKIAEHGSVMLPVIVGYDGWEVSHASSRVRITDQEDIDTSLPLPTFIKPEKDLLAIDWKERFSSRRRVRGFGGSDFMDLRYLQKKAEADSAQVIEDVGREYQKSFGSPHVGLMEIYKCEDADLVLLTMGIIYPVATFVVDALREKGVRIGCIKLRAFRPFPAKAVCETLRSAKLVISIERNSLASLFSELRASLYSYQFSRDNGLGPMVMGRIVGLGGEGIHPDLLGHIVEEGLRAMASGKVEKEFDWYPLKGIQFDPTRDSIAE